MIILPTSPLFDYTQSVVMDNVGYDIRLQFNPREAAWYMYLGLSGQDYAIKTKIVNGWDILEPFRHLEDIPNGELYLLDTVAAFGRVGQDDLKSEGRFVLAYITEEELP